MGGFSEIAAGIADAPFQRQSATSKAAAMSMDGRSAKYRKAIIEYLRGHPGGRTDEAMQIELAMAPNTQRPRRRELEQAGIIEDSGSTERTNSGRKAVLWRLKQETKAP